MSRQPARSVDLNSDLGEGFGVWRLGDDEALLEVVTSANVACGFHAGDATTMRRVCEHAVRREVSIGAQVGYRDLAGFGRRRIDIDPDELAADVLYQVGALDAIARAAGGRVAYVKPHGALYNRTVDDSEQAAAVVRAVLDHGGDLPVVGLPGSVLLGAAAEAGLRPVTEGFPDRGYTADGTLVPRGQPGAVLTDPTQVASRALELAATVDTLCVHGDTPGAVHLARAVRDALADAGLAVTSFG
ncbi:MAG: 5-oxoprolinase (ATP-hydrolyzing) subunit [Actinomycetota bacterium]|jgi:UPF0271 protein|nr:5-oxoprolinase (ATP-hydrolyzing) subunit [Actinomycetota bacterium]